MNGTSGENGGSGGNAHCDSLEVRATSGENGSPKNGFNASSDGSANCSS